MNDLANHAHVMNASWESNVTQTPSLTDPAGNITLSSVVREYTYADLPLPVFIAALLVASVIGNLIIILAFCRSSRLRTPSNALLLNLAIAGLTASIFALPAWIITTVLPQTAVQYMQACHAVAMVTVMLFMESIFSLAAIAVDKFVYVCYPFKYQRLFTGKSVSSFLICTWAYASGLAVLPSIVYSHGGYTFRPFSVNICSQDFNNDTFTSIMMGASILPGYAVIVFCNVHVFIVARRQAIKIRNIESSIRAHQAIKRAADFSPNVNSKTACGRLSQASIHLPRLRPWKRASVVVRKHVQRSRLLRTVLIILLVFLFSWTPFIVMAIQSAIFNVTPPAWLELVVIYLFHASFVLNPLACMFVDKEYRTGVKKLLGLRRREVLMLAVTAFAQGGAGAATRVHKHEIKDMSGIRSEALSSSSFPSGTLSRSQDVFCVYSPSITSNNNDL